MTKDVPKSEDVLAKQSGLTIKDVLELYENGKQRRYGLLFSVNGAAFAIATLLVRSSDKASVVVGNLKLGTLAFGIMAISTILTFDIYFFGQKMRFFRDAHQPDCVFARPGKVFLIALWNLLIMGWWLAAGWAVPGR